MCNKRIGTNKFYEPEIKGAKKFKTYLSNYNLKLDEQQALYKELIKMGLSHNQAKYRVANRKRYIWWFQKKRLIKKSIDFNNMQKKLVEGLQSYAKS